MNVDNAGYNTKPKIPEHDAQIGVGIPTEHLNILNRFLRHVRPVPAKCNPL